MGILKKKVTDPTPVEPTKLRRMQTDDVYLALETSLMESQYALSQYRKMAVPADKDRALAWLHAEIQTSELACRELISRNT